ncbi:2-amino-4-hydroxy-6-hydroxymethyldihydropteridinepyrophosphokinase [Pseudooceanicola marinus]|uniref:2-amino-4-hydroxy-6-hydroxymethyldihydropteridine pyrophosphokinase n=1 Tax=Pseudooceanicola marinus TaxID=396013 RepID=A0A1X6ZU52_9RHOB|nr:2-amino-4-hydroxy-6-hydroxymethyldihydropteridine diphosphokinase [Pseudooceanicola marinus]PJE30595.1 2-amino-4-hydroxy-6-hydroxymethyldihydropteridine diphosphokinase [Pseudooceanicola marinus]SLN61376.1 2-amino-4-hydroxy-6-hydroxymethyldihydropteridinepyrophosphokinase [Pseudooceanicola marinus]
MSKSKREHGLQSVNHHFLIALGGNIEAGPGGIAATLTEAVEALRAGPGQVTAVSPFYRSPAFPAGSGPDYINAALTLESVESPEVLLARLHAVEQDFGRERKTRWGARVLDLDLIACDGEIRPDTATQTRWRSLPLARQMAEAPGELILPHPRLQDRAFVLVPLADVAPDWVHPLLCRSVAQMCRDLPAEDRRALVPVT